MVAGLLGGVVLVVLITFAVHELRVEGPRRLEYYRRLEAEGLINKKM